MAEEMRKKLQTTQRRMMRMIIQTKRKPGKCRAASHAASVDDIADDELHDPDSESENETTEPNPKDPQRIRRKQSRRGQQSLLRQRTTIRVGRRTGTMGRLDNARNTRQMTCWQTERDFLETGKDDCRTPRGTLDKASRRFGIPAQPNREGTRSKEDWPRDGKTPATKINRDNNDLTSDTTWLTTAQDGSKWELHGKCDFFKQQTRATNTTHDPLPITTTTTTQPTTYEQTMHTTKAHRQDDGGANDDDDDDTRKNGNQCVSDALIPSEPHFPFHHRYRPTPFQAARGRVGVPVIVVPRSEFLCRHTGKGPMHTHSGLRASQSFV